MDTPTLAASRWSTASYGDAADTSPMELSALGEHLSVCKSASGRLFALRCGVDVMHGFVSSRLVTTVVVVAGLMILASLLLP